MKHFRDWEGSTALAGFDPLGKRIIRPRGYVKDGFQTFDQATIDSAGAFLVGELERLDPMIHEPLVSVTWSRDIDLRTDVQIGDEQTSYTLSSFAAAGGAVDNGINWIGKKTTAIPGVEVDIAKIPNFLDLVGYEVNYTIPELKSAEQTGRPIDVQKLAAMNLKHQMDADQMVYIGDSVKLNPAGSATGGLVNHSLVTNTANVANGAAGSALWINKSPDEILTDVNEVLVSVWAATGYSVPPTKLLIAPVPFGYISTTAMAIGGTGVAETILSYVKTRNILTAQTGQPLEIQAVKWLDHTVRGVSTDRMVAYAQDQKYVRFPLVPLQSVAPQYRGIHIAVPYFGRIGAVEMVYFETAAYRDGIG